MANGRTARAEQLLNGSRRLAATCGFALAFVVARQVFIDVHDVVAFEVEASDLPVAVPSDIF